MASAVDRSIRCAAGDSLHVRILREGRELEVAYKVEVRQPLVPVLHGVHGCTPTYFTIAGLIFVPLSIPFLEHAYGGAPPKCLTARPPPLTWASAKMTC